MKWGRDDSVIRRDGRGMKRDKSEEKGMRGERDERGQGREG
jgi:hypothetical protein